MKRVSVVAAAAILGATQPLGAQGSGVIQTDGASPAMGMHHVAITVSDIDSSIAFYSKAVPYAVVKRYRLNGSVIPVALTHRRYRSVDVAVIITPTTFIQLMDFEPAKGPKAEPRPVIGPGYTHICFQSPSSAPAIARFLEAGLEKISRFGKPDGVDIGGYGVRYAYGRDPDGIMIENESLDMPKRSEVAWLTHIANVAHDRDAMLDFYAKVLGRQPHRKIEQENRPRLDDVANIDGLKIRGGWISVGNMEIEVWQYVKPQTPRAQADRKLDEIGYNSFGLEVADLERERGRLNALGVRLAGPVIQVDGWAIQYAYDPEGNLFSVQQNQSAGPDASVARFIPAAVKKE